MIDRLLAASGREAPELAAAKLVAFSRTLTLVVAVEMWESLPYWVAAGSGSLHQAKAILGTLAALLSWKAPRLGCALLLPLCLLELVAAFPECANHHYLIALCLLLVAATSERQDEALPLVQTLRCIGALGLFWAGLQKLFGGYYVTGTFLAYAISRNERFAAYFRPLLGSDEVARLQAIELAEGAVYRIADPLFIVVSNLTWIGELVLPALLFVPRLRNAALVAMLAYIVGIEIAAREIFFGVLIVSLILLFAPFDANRRALPWWIALFALALASRTPLVPHWVFT